MGGVESSTHCRCFQVCSVLPYVTYYYSCVSPSRVVAQKFQDFAQKKKLKHAGDPDVCNV